MMLTKSLVLILCATMSFARPPTAQNNPSEKAAGDSNEAWLIGDWRGDSICVVRESACHDEDSLYHLAKLPEKPGWFSMKADKIVDGKPVTMGTVECSYDVKQHSLECAIPRGGVLRFTAEENKMQGSMTLADKTLWRKISLKKVKS